MDYTKHILFLLVLLILPVPQVVHALDTHYTGISYGPATSSLPAQFDPDTNLYVFLGFQKEYYLTYEVGLSNFNFSTFEGQDRHKSATILSGSLLAHFPVGDSSLFGRIGISGYQYYDNKDDLQNVFVTVYGAGFDLAIEPKLSLRFEWLRYNDLEYNQQLADIETWRAGIFIYF